MSEPTQSPQSDGSDGSTSCWDVSTIDVATSFLTDINAARNMVAEFKSLTTENSKRKEHNANKDLQNETVYSGLSPIYSTKFDVNKLLRNNPRNELLDLGLIPLPCTKFKINESVADDKKYELFISGLSPISCTEFEAYESVGNEQSNELLDSGLTPLSCTEFEKNESAISELRLKKEKEFSGSLLSLVSSDDNLSEHDVDNDRNVGLHSDLSTISSDQLVIEREDHEILDAGDLLELYKFVNESQQSRRSDSESSIVSTTTSCDSFEQKRTNFQETKDIERYLTRDAYPTLNSDKHPCLDITSQELAIKSRRDNEEKLKSTYPELKIKICDIPLPPDKDADVPNADEPKAEFTEAVFQETKKAFCETGVAEHIRKWPLEKIEAEIVQFKKEADIKRAKLVCRGKIMDKEIKQLKANVKQAETAKKRFDEWKNKRDGEL